MNSNKTQKLNDQKVPESRDTKGEAPLVRHNGNEEGWSRTKTQRKAGTTERKCEWS